MKAAAYLRVSSRAQSAAMQRDAIERAAQARGDSIAVEYTEARSARTMLRPELQRLLDHARAGRVRRIYVFRLDRLVRSGIRDMLAVVEQLRSYGCELVSISDGFDINGPAAEIVLAVLAWAAQVERLAINERIAAARDRVERRGGSWGRPRRMAPGQIARARALKSCGRTIRQIAVALKISRATIGRALSQKPRAVSPGPARRKARPGALASR